MKPDLAVFLLDYIVHTGKEVPNKKKSQFNLGQYGVVQVTESVNRWLLLGTHSRIFQVVDSYLNSPSVRKYIIPKQVKYRVGWKHGLITAEGFKKIGEIARELYSTPEKEELAAILSGSDLIGKVRKLLDSGSFMGELIKNKAEITPLIYKGSYAESAYAKFRYEVKNE